QQAVEVVGAAARDKGIAIELDLGGAQALGDARATEQVLVNLLDNAVKYTPAGGRVHVSAARADGRVRVDVADSGPGIPPEHVPRIFERFYRVDSGRSRDQGGTGLGLAIVKHLVEAMGGAVSVQSAVGKGTTLTFEL